MRVKASVSLLVLAVLLELFLVVSPVHSANVETRYLQSATQSINTKTVHKLLVTPVELSKTDSDTLCTAALDSTLYPTSDSSIQWTKSEGSTNYGCIDEVTANDTDYVSCSVYDKTDVYGHTAFSLASGLKVGYVRLGIRYKCKSALRVGFSIGGTVYYNTVASSSSYTVKTSVFELDPSTSQEWTQAGLNAALMYVRSVSFEPYTDYVSQFYVQVYTYTDYTAEWAFQVWKLAADGTETEITSGKTTVFTSLVSAFHNAGLSANPVEYFVNWVCPLTALVATDAVEMAMYVKNSAGTYLLQSAWKFGTEQLGAGSLDAATWTLYFWLYSQGTTTTVVSWHTWGTAAYDGRIEGFTWSAPSGQNLTFTLGDQIIVTASQSTSKALSLRFGDSVTALSSAKESGAKQFTLTSILQCFGSESASKALAFSASGLLQVLGVSSPSKALDFTIYDLLVILDESRVGKELWLRAFDALQVFGSNSLSKSVALQFFDIIIICESASVSAAKAFTQFEVFDLVKVVDYVVPIDLFDLATVFFDILICVPLALALGMVFNRRRRKKLESASQP